MTIPGRYELQISFYRGLADRIVTHAVADEKFRARLLSEPVKVLQDEGLPRGVSQDISKELFGHDSIIGTCGAASCWITCYYTCKSATNPA
jgi:hypothetical protein